MDAIRCSPYPLHTTGVSAPFSDETDQVSSENPGIHSVRMAMYGA